MVMQREREAIDVGALISVNVSVPQVWNTTARVPVPDRP